jgi:NodT family efflux transporter outer membrane factor (OMF) lipoprotein
MARRHVSSPTPQGAAPEGIAHRKFAWRGIVRLAAVRVSAVRLGIVALAAVMVASCTVGPDFARPETKVPPSWNDHSQAPTGADHTTAIADPDPKWWLAFGDPVLTSLIRRASQGNLDLQIAVVRIAEARASESAAAAAGLPNVNAKASYTHADLGHGLFPGSSSLGSSLSGPLNVYLGVVDASWEVDLFGKVRRSVEAARAGVDAAIGNRDDAIVVLEAEVAQTYAQLRAGQASRQTALDDLDTEQQILALTRDRAAHGLVTDLDVENAATALATTEASIAQYDQQIAAAKNALAVLVGEAPGALDAELADAAPIPPVPPSVPLGLPSSLARRRPDIRVAEANLHQMTAQIGVAQAQFYPDLSLTGMAGPAGSHPSDLRRWADKFYSVGPSISLPIFDGGKLRANLELANADQAEAALTYRKTVLNALQDIENALAAYRTELRRHEALEKTVAAQTAALDIARNQYAHGVSTFINVLTAENSLAGQHQQLIQSTLSLTTDVVNLYKALGGGWEAGAEPGAATGAATGAAAGAAAG